MGGVNDTLPTEADLQLWHTSRGLSPVYDAGVHPLPPEPVATPAPSAEATGSAEPKTRRRGAAKEPGEVEATALNDAGHQPQTNPPATQQESTPGATDT